MSSICVHGLGYVGLPTAAMLSNFGHSVIGYDSDDVLIENLNDGDVHVDEPGLRAFVTEALESKSLKASNEVRSAKYHIICVPTPLDQNEKIADLSHVEDAGNAIKPHLRPGDSVILESTVPPGTTVRTLKPTLELSGLEAGEDFALVHCPETVLPGNIITELRENDRIIGGVNGVSTEAAVRLYESFVIGDIHTTVDATTAEFVKLIQNTFRDTNIALANEFSKLARDYNIDSRTAINLANEHPRVEIHQPGPGVGGHCIPVDPWFLGQNSDELNLVKTARKLNAKMVDYVMNIIMSALGSLDNKRVAILGVAYKGNVNDTRNSPGIKLAQRLQARQKEAPAPISKDGGEAFEVTVLLNDPHVDDQTLNLRPLEEATRNSDVIVITTDHDEYSNINPETVADQVREKVVIDTKAVLDRSQWEDAGFKLIRI